MTHTPGPWELVVWKSKRGANIFTDDAIICDVSCRVNGDNAIANARLISAAPELLEACKAALKWIEDTDHQSEYDLNSAGVQAQLRAAIEKAGSNG